MAVAPRGEGASIIGVGIHIPSLHYYLWIRREPRLNTIRIHTGRLAKQIGVNPQTMSRKISTMVDEGRLLMTGQQLPANQRGYTVVDPATFVVPADPGLAVIPPS